MSVAWPRGQRAILWAAVLASAGCRGPGFEPCPGGCPPGQICDRQSGRCLDQTSGCPEDLGRYLSLAADAAGNLQVAFYDPQAGDLIVGAWQGNGGLKCEIADGAGAANDDVGLYASLALDRLGNPWVAYFDRSHGRLKLAWKSAGEWKTLFLPGAEGQVLGRSCRLRLDQEDLPHLGYFNESTGRPEVARLLSDGRWVVEPIFPTPLAGWGGSFGGEIGRRLDLVLGGNGQEWLFFSDPADGALRVAGKQAADWQVLEVEPGPDAAGWLSAELDTAGNPAVVYHRSRSGELIFAENRGGLLVRTIIDDGRRAWGRSLTGGQCALVFGGDGLPRVLYLDGGELAPRLALGEKGGGFSTPAKLPYENPAGFFPAAVDVPGGVSLALVEFSRPAAGSWRGRIDRLRLEVEGSHP